MRLTDEQRALVLEWIAAGAREWGEIEAKAAKHDPPFSVTYPQFKRLRKKAGVEVKKLRLEGKKAAVSKGYALIENQIALLKRLVEKHLSLIEDRGEEMAEEIAGGDTGLLVRTYSGKERFYDRATYKYDAAIIREIRELLKQIAILKGFWMEKTALANPDGTSLLDPIIQALNKAYGDEQGEPVQTD